MLDNSVLSQLSQLKKDIQDSREYGTGVVAATNGRFGFVRLDDGRDAYLSPDKMQHVLPGDRVKVELKTNDKGKLEANFEKLLEKSLDRFIGQYRIKGNAHFVAPSGAQASRWLFLPPKNRDKCMEGDFVVSKLIKHPYKDGKAAAKIVERIGQPEEPKIEHKYTRAKYNLNFPSNPHADKETSALEALFNNEGYGDSLESIERQDMTHVPFVTIDAATTKDMDDGLAIETVEKDGQSYTRLLVAIADPGHFIRPGSELAKQSEVHGQSIYLLGGSIPMLPGNLAHHCFSLEENKVRPALVCQIDFDADGDIKDYEFIVAKIKSHHKLAYDNVAAYLEESGEELSIPEACVEPVRQLRELSVKRAAYRQANYIIGNDQADYDYQLDDAGKIKSIHVKPRNMAHQIVEEAMLATNMCAGQLLAEHQVGICTRHNGFRAERLGEVKALLKEEGIEFDDSINSLEGHIDLLKRLEKSEDKQALLAPLRRMMQPAELSNTAHPHLGMGFPYYATITSPIRRYADLFNHWAIQAVLAKNEAPSISEEKLSKIFEGIQNSRQADRELHQWLITQYTQNIIGETGKGLIRIVTQHGFGVRLNETGIDGFIAYPKNVEKTFDAKRMTLIVDGVTYHIGKEVDVKVVSVDMDKRRIAFEINKEA